MNETQLKDIKNFIKSANQLIDEGANEQVVRDNFTSQLRTIYPKIPKWIIEHILGGETALKSYKSDKVSTGFVDNLVGLTPIEYEKDLRKQDVFKVGYSQVKEYSAALLNEGYNSKDIIGVLSDTIRWYAYKIEIRDDEIKSPAKQEDVVLTELECIDISDSTDHSVRLFDNFVNKYLKRIGSRPLSAESIARDLGFDSRFCRKHLQGLKTLVQNAFATNEEHADLIKKLWLENVNIAVAEGEVHEFDKDEYMREVYILTIGKLICANSLEEKALISDENSIREILDGEFFSNRGLANFIEYDYFGWINNETKLQEQLIDIAKAIQQDLQAYNFNEVPDEDLFGQLMSQLAERSKRILLGQEWTPSWLANKIVKNTISKLPENENPRFIDMCCGSGAFIVEVVNETSKIIEKSNPNMTREDELRILSNCITGFDIDPLAVMLSRITWVISLKERLKPLGTYSLEIPIYHADSLFAIKLHSNDTTADNNFRIILDKYELNLPVVLVSPSMQKVFDSIINNVYSLAVKSNKPSIEKGKARNIVQNIINNHNVQDKQVYEEDVVTFFQEILEIIYKLNSEGRNGIWAYILKNNYRPSLVSGQFNGLISNPPWLALSKIANNPYKSVLGDIASSLQIKPQGASFPHVEMSTIFLLESVRKYLKDGALVACILPETVLNGSQHKRFREGLFKQSVELRFEEIWKVDESTFKNRSIVLFGRKASFTTESLIKGNEVYENKVDEIEYHVCRLGDRTVWSEKELTDISELYDPAPFEQGADIMPRSLFFHNVTPTPDKNKVELSPISVSSDSLSFLVKDSKKCKDFMLPQPCIVNKEYVFEVYLSKLLSPFFINSPVSAFLPLRKNADSWSFVSEDTLLDNPDNRLTLKAFNRIVQEVGKLDDNSNPKIEDVWKRINYRNKIQKQVYPCKGYIVFTGAGGSNVCSAYVDLGTIDVTKTIFDQTLYWAHVETESEAIYLTGMFNSPAANELIKEFQPRGRQGERHVHSLAFGITPRFDPEQPSHLEVVGKTKNLIREFNKLMSDGNKKEAINKYLDPNKSLSHRRRKLTEILETLNSFSEYSTACSNVYDV